MLTELGKKAKLAARQLARLTTEQKNTALQNMADALVQKERIEIRGNRRIPEDTIRFYIQSRQGEIYDEGRLELDLRALYKANFFEKIEVQERDGDTGTDAAYLQTNLVSNGVIPAANTDPLLRNAWGLAASSTSPFWVADNGSGNTSIYKSDGTTARRSA